MSTTLAIQQQQQQPQQQQQQPPAFFPVQRHDSHNTRTELTPPPSPKSSPSPTLSLAKLKRQEYSTSTPMLKTIYSCNVCGKQYKHRNCLVKHLWEHHESWQTCLKFNVTKHQQVQMMEAAQILVNIACVSS